MARVAPLTEDELAVGLTLLPDWTVVDGKLHRDLTFADFGAAFSFMTRVAIEADKRDHHPEWSNVYNRVTIDLVTHDADGISARDLDLAAVIDSFL